MNFVVIIGSLVCCVGIFGLLACIRQGIKIKQLEQLGNLAPKEIKTHLSGLYVKNMFILSLALFGLIIVGVGLILDY